ncbi:hypothetical protein COT97_03815 [Candidatus Falkowbacteria bacterium CG10_big_fil_rev_8_21_14_0_10_39_11]|uniref:Uncharacterized protein n=1 Tax=Candidatus Falkowbacteria bacterium CG10_big_fil_rev_8_21_14_0_10_39_11 TaxID=1974565 RepID=A0A2H0V4F7_9BACT|nr:MAG: hypothetical protein COT97_03815 [Candidatus Falkowbacteria bacterium CG10_big_fil_rev_8_21_14_0_10_39_11]
MVMESKVQKYGDILVQIKDVDSDEILTVDQDRLKRMYRKNNFWKNNGITFMTLALVSLSVAFIFNPNLPVSAILINAATNLGALYLLFFMLIIPQVALYGLVAYGIDDEVPEVTLVLFAGLLIYLFISVIGWPFVCNQFGII